MECARLVIGSNTGNHVMFIGGLDDNAPYSGRGLPLYPGQEHEREMFIENSNRVRVCATFSGELLYYMGYINGSPTLINPSTQGTQPNNEPPFLVRTDPLNQQTNVEFQGSGLNFVAIFNENIASGTVDTSSMSIRLSGNFTQFLSGSTSYFAPESEDDRTKIAFTPASGQLLGSSWYTVFIGTRISDDFGSNIPSTLTWSFVTAGVDDSPMFLTVNSPVSGTVLAPFSQRIEATFSKRISGIINNTGYDNNVFLWNDSIPALGISGITILDGDISASGRKLTFTPINLLTPSTLYRYTISGVLDQFGNFAPPQSGIAFSTGPADTAGPIISGVVPISGASGNVPTLTNLTVTFDEKLSGIVGGVIASPVIQLANSGAQATLLSGIITLSTSGNTLTFDPTSELISGTAYLWAISGVYDVNGNVLTQTNPPRSGLAFRTWVEADVAPPIPTITPISGSVGISHGINVVVSFNEQISGTPGDATFTTIVALNLSGTGNVAGATSLNTSGTIVTFNPSADLSGDRTYFVSVSGALDLASNRMSPISGHPFRTIDNIAPIISGTVPTSGAIDVAPTANIVITFSEAISGTAGGSITNDVVRLYKSGVPANAFAGARTLDATRTQLTFNPTSELEPNEHYMFGVSGIIDVSGNSMSTATATNSGISFQTVGGPLITATNPVSGASGIALASNIVVTFNKALSGTPNGTVTAPVFRLWASSASPVALAGTNTLNGDATQLTFDPTAALLSDTLYLFAISGVRDLSGNIITQTTPPRSGFAFRSFLVDITPPTITTTNPVSGATNVSVSASFVINFSETISGNSGSQVGINNTTSGIVRMWLSGITNLTASGVHGFVEKTANNQITFRPNETLSGSKIYRVGVTGVFDLQTNVLGGTRSGFVFTTLDNIVPTVVSISPVSGSTGIAVSQFVNITMSEAISGTAGNGTLTSASAVTCHTVNTGTIVPGTVNLDATKTIVTFDQVGSWTSNTQFEMRVSGLRDTGDNFNTPVVGHTFTTSGPILTVFYDQTGNTERPFGTVSPVLVRAGEMRNNSGSAFNGKRCKRAIWALRRVGTPGGTLRTRIRGDIDGADSIEVDFDTIMNANDVSTVKTRYTFEKLTNTYALTTDDAITIELIGATQNGSNYISVYYDGADPFDGEDTGYVDYDTEWNLGLVGDNDIDARFEE